MKQEEERQAVIGVGKQLGNRLPERSVRIGAAAAFLAFGVVLLVDGVAG